jgi:DNA-binding transcriptional LysR family regulator
MDTLQNMRVFVRVVEEGSFTAAAQHLNTTTAYASRAISDLEAHLHTRLLNRTTRGIALTEAGERYLQRCEQILAYVEEAEAEASDAHARPSGKLKVHAMTSFGQHYVVPAVSDYHERYPEVHVELTLAQRIPDLLDEGYDVSLVLAESLPDSGLVSQRLGSGFSITCAAPAYLERHGVPRPLTCAATSAFAR